MIAIHQIAHCTALQCLVSKNRRRPQVFSWETPEAWFAFCLFIGDLIISRPTWWEHLRTLIGAQLPQGLGNLFIFAIRFATNPHLVPGWGGGGGGGLHWLLHKNFGCKIGLFMVVMEFCECLFRKMIDWSVVLFCPVPWYISRINAHCKSFTVHNHLRTLKRHHHYQNKDVFEIPKYALCDFQFILLEPYERIESIECSVLKVN